MADYNEKDGELMNVSLSHGLIFPDEFKDRLKDAILRGLRNVNYKNVPGLNAIRGRKLLQIPGTVGVFTNSSGGVFEHMSASDIGTHPDVIVRGIADGKYMIFFSCQISAGAGGGWAALSINGAAPSTDFGVQGISVGSIAYSRSYIATLKNDDNNTIELMARNDTAGSMFLDYPSISIMKIADQ